MAENSYFHDVNVHFLHLNSYNSFLGYDSCPFWSKKLGSKFLSLFLDPKCSKNCVFLHGNVYGLNGNSFHSFLEYAPWPNCYKK